MPDAKTTVQVAAEVIDQAARLANLYSLGVVLAIIITIAFVALMGFVLWTNHKRESALAAIINTTVKQMNDALLAHDTRSIDAVKSLSQANEYQRQEHQEIIKLIHSRA